MAESRNTADDALTRSAELLGTAIGTATRMVSVALRPPRTQ